MNQGLHPDGPDWETLTRAWREIGLGELEVVEPGAGLLEIRISNRGSSAVSRETVRDLLRGKLADLAAEPVGIAEGPEENPAAASIRFLVGSPRLIAKIGPDYESGVDASMLTEGVSS